MSARAVGAKPRTGNLGGRPSLFTAERREKILTALRGGNFRNVACQWARIDDSTMRLWMKRGERDPKSEYAAFRAEVFEAEQFAELEMVRCVVEGAKNDPRHAQWWLERKCNERWGRKDSVALTGKRGGPIQAEVTHFDLTKLTDDELATLEAIATRIHDPESSEPGESEA